MSAGTAVLAVASTDTIRSHFPAPRRALERERGVRVAMARMRVENGTLDLEDLERKITPRTRLVAIGAASNALGTINDLQRIVAMARAQRALVFVDAVHHAPHAL